MKLYVCLASVLGIAFVGVLGVAADIPQVRETMQLADSLDAQQQAVFSRIEARRQIVEEVIAGRLTLMVAADKFGALNAQEPESMTAVRLNYRGDSDRKSLCQQVLHHVQVALEGRSSEAEAVIPRLEREMQAYIGEDGPGA
jgi:hypothetical protein